MTKVSKEQPLELIFTVKVHAYGRLGKVKRDIGNTLAKACRLKLGPKVEVWSGRRQFKWDPNVHAGGTPDFSLTDDLEEDDIWLNV
jgi:hypothetical protein